MNPTNDVVSLMIKNLRTAAPKHKNLIPLKKECFTNVQRLQTPIFYVPLFLNNNLGAKCLLQLSKKSTTYIIV